MPPTSPPPSSCSSVAGCRTAPRRFFPACQPAVSALAPLIAKRSCTAAPLASCLLPAWCPAQQHISACSLVAATGAEYRTGSSSLAASCQPQQRPLLPCLAALFLRRSVPCSGKRRHWLSTANAGKGSHPLNPQICSFKFSGRCGQRPRSLPAFCPAWKTRTDFSLKMQQRGAPHLVRPV